MAGGGGLAILRNYGFFIFLFCPLWLKHPYLKNFFFGVAPSPYGRPSIASGCLAAGRLITLPYNPDKRAKYIKIKGLAVLRLLALLSVVAHLASYVKVALLRL